MKKLSVFRAGTYPQATVTVEDLTRAAEAYDPKLLHAPLTADHQQSGPAFGWFNRFWVEGDKLMTELDPAEITPEGFAEIRSGRWGPPSVELYHPDNPNNPVPGTQYIKAVTMLGAKPPAVKGLDPIKFSEAERKALDAASLEGVLIFEDEPPPIDELKIAVPGAPWDVEEAKKRIKERFGWWGLSSLSLYRDWDKGWDDYASYQALVVDIVFNEPMIVPAAVDAALERIPKIETSGTWGKVDREAALSRAQTLAKRISEEQKAVGFSDDEHSGGHVNRKKLLELIQKKAKGIIADDKVTAFAESVADSIFADNPEFSEFSEAGAVLFAERIISAELKAAKAEADAAQVRAEAETRAAEFAENQHRSAVTARVESLVAAGRIPPKRKDDFVAFGMALPADEESFLTFSEDGKEAKRSLWDVFCAFAEEFFPVNKAHLDEIAKDDGKNVNRFSEEEEAGKRIAAHTKKSKE